MELDQETILKFQMFEQQINQINQQIEAVEQGLNDLVSVGQGLEELEGKKDQEILAPIGRGIFAKAKLVSEELVVDVGDRNFVDKSIPDTRKIIEDQITKLEEIREELTSSLEEINQELTKVMFEAQKKNKVNCENENCKCEEACGEECGCD